MTAALWIIAAVLIARFCLAVVEEARTQKSRLLHEEDCTLRRAHEEGVRQEVEEEVAHRQKHLQMMEAEKEATAKAREVQEELRDLAKDYEHLANALLSRGCDRKVVMSVFRPYFDSENADEIKQKLAVLKVASADQES